MNSAILAESYDAAKLEEYIRFVEHLGPNVQFHENKWLCSNLRRSPAEKSSAFTLYFGRIPKLHKEAVKCFVAISLIRGKKISTVKAYMDDLVRFFDFWSLSKGTLPLSNCDEFAATDFYRYLEKRGLAETTCIGVWSSLSTFFETMNGIDGVKGKNPFGVSPYCRQRRYDAKYIPEPVAVQLDAAFKSDEIALYLRCAYWLLRLIPSRIGEILGMKIDCLKRFNGQYVLFIPTWKQNGGWQQPATRSIHLEDKGIAGYLIGLIKEQQETARQIQEFLPEDKKGMLFSYRQSYCRKGKPTYSTKLCFVASIFTVNDHFRNICRRYNILDETGNVYVVTTHQFRHNGITDRLAAGFTAAQIAEMTGHHGDAMIFNAYAHLNLMPETIREKQNYVLAERQESDKRYVLFGGRILNMDEQMEQRLMKNLRAHRVRGGICSDITNCKSDMWNCLECKAFVPDAEQIEYYREQISLWCEKQIRFSAFPLICDNAKRNAELFESILKSIETDVQRNETNNT